MHNNNIVTTSNIVPYTEGIVPTNFGWAEQDGVLQPHWFACPAVSEELFVKSNISTIMNDNKTCTSDSEDAKSRKGSEFNGI